MRIGTPSLVVSGIILAIIAFYNQASAPLFASLLAMAGAGFLLVAAKRMTKERKALKSKKQKK